jgi:hypothetical protein
VTSVICSAGGELGATEQDPSSRAPGNRNIRRQPSLPTGLISSAPALDLTHEAAPMIRRDSSYRIANGMTTSRSRIATTCPPVLLKLAQSCSR